ncbi:hypothetical protein B0H11DRAFT_2011298, partial [Mycena galericulata]
MISGLAPISTHASIITASQTEIMHNVEMPNVRVQKERQYGFHHMEDRTSAASSSGRKSLAQGWRRDRHNVLSRLWVIL